jgi:ABC-type dipeptide/oligopeptide/nickel transport system permease subunit
VAGYVGGRVDHVMMRIVDILYALPFMFFVILLMVFFGRNIILIFVAIGAINWLDMARIVRGQTLSLKHKEFVEAAEAQGVATSNIIRRHIVPNLLGVVVVYVTLTIPQVILVESFLSFLGLGVQEPMTSWGALVNEGAQEMGPRPGCWCSRRVPGAHAVLLQLRRRRAARRAGPEGPLMALLRSTGSTCASARPTARCTRCATCRSRWRAARRSASSASRARARASR